MPGQAVASRVRSERRRRRRRRLGLAKRGQIAKLLEEEQGAEEARVLRYRGAVIHFGQLREAMVLKHEGAEQREETALAAKQLVLDNLRGMEGTHEHWSVRNAVANLLEAFRGPRHARKVNK